MVLEFHKLEYYEKFDFTKLEYSKINRFLRISEIVINYDIIYENMLFDYFYLELVTWYFFLFTKDKLHWMLLRAMSEW